MGRRKTYDRDEVVAKAMELFWRQGYNGTSTQDLVEYMGINRYSLYAEFKSKHDLFLATLDYYQQTVVTRNLCELEREDADFAAVQRLFQHFSKPPPGTSGMGCLLCNTGAELGASDPDSRTKFQQYAKRLERAFRNALENAHKSGEISESVSVADAARSLTTTMLGMSLLVRTQGNIPMLRTAARMAIQAITQQSNTSDQALAG